MTEKFKYDVDYLTLFCDENGIELLKDYRSCNVTSETQIDAKCIIEDCEECMITKSFRNMVKSRNFRCKKHYKDKWLNECNRINFDYNYLNTFCDENSIELLKDYSTEKVNRDTKILAKCIQCEDPMVQKTFRLMVKNRNFGCKKHSLSIRLEKSKISTRAKYGCDFASQNKEVRQKVENTTLQRYGVKHISHSKEIAAKRKATNLESYGVEYPSQRDIVKQRVKNTNLERHGCEYASQSEEVKQKIKATNLAKYGTESTLQNKDIRQKGVIKIQERYGVSNVSQNEDIKQLKRQSTLKNYGVEHPMQSQEIREKSIKTNIKKYGVSYASQREEIKQQIKNTNLEKLGCEYSLQSQDVREKGYNTMMEKYGVKHPIQNKDIKQKTINTNLEKWGCEYGLQNDEVKAKGIETNMKKYGVPNPMQNAEVSAKCSKSAYKCKEFTFPSGRIDTVQGYEPFALKELLNDMRINEDNIITQRNEVPEIWWIDNVGKKHRYFVDIFILNQKKCIEVKSTWTISIKRDIILLKQLATKNQGYACEVWVYDSKGVRVETLL